MSDIRVVEGLGAILPRFGGTLAAEARSDDGSVAVQDRVEISELARTLSIEEHGSDIRFDKVVQVREALARGDYLTPERINIAIERALASLNG